MSTQDYAIAVTLKSYEIKPGDKNSELNKEIALNYELELENGTIEEDMRDKLATMERHFKGRKNSPFEMNTPYKFDLIDNNNENIRIYTESGPCIVPKKYFMALSLS